MFRAWTARYGKANVATIDRLKQFELENARPKKALAHANGHLQRLPANTSSAAYPPARIRNAARGGHAPLGYVDCRLFLFRAGPGSSEGSDRPMLGFCPKS